MPLSQKVRFMVISRPDSDPSYVWHHENKNIFPLTWVGFELFHNQVPTATYYFMFPFFAAMTIS